MSGAEKALECASERLASLLVDAISKGPHPNPHSKFVRVRLDVVHELIDHLDWMEKGNAEWRATAHYVQGEVARLGAVNKVAINHLQAVLNKARTFDEQQAADTAARDWLTSIGSEPT